MRQIASSIARASCSVRAFLSAAKSLSCSLCTGNSCAGASVAAEAAYEGAAIAANVSTAIAGRSVLDMPHTPFSTTIVGRRGRDRSDTEKLRSSRKSSAKPSPIRAVNALSGVECRCIGKMIDE